MRLHTLAYLSADPFPPREVENSSILLQNFKSHLKLGIAHYSPQTSRDEPTIQWSDHQQIALNAVQQALPQLLATLNKTQILPSTWASPFASEMQPSRLSLSISSNAVGLATAEFRQALAQLAGVIVNAPADWSDTYRFNIREAILGAGLVSRPEAIFLLEDAIATVLSGFKTRPDPEYGSTTLKLNSTAEADLQGQTLVISAGASTTEIALVNIPMEAQNLTYKDFALRSLPYAGNALDQDILCQLIYSQMSGRKSPGKRSPTYRSALLLSDPSGSGVNRSSLQRFQPGIAQPGWTSEGQDGMASDLNGLDLPLPGEPDAPARCLLQQRLNSSAWGQQLLEAARYLKMILQHQDRFTLELDQERIVVLRRQLESLVFVPFIQRLNRELNTLLAQTGISTLAIEQVICTGGTASLPAIARWLRQKLPNATLIQDTYPAHATLTQTCSRVAYGLATLPLYPQVLNLPHQQYSDYFLLLELLRACPEQAMSVGEIMTLLEQRGINTEACQFALLALLEGQLPTGLVPTDDTLDWLSPISRQNPDYPALTAEPLFYKEGYQTYRLNPQQRYRLRLYLNRVLASTYQKLEEPLPGTLTLPSLQK